MTGKRTNIYAGHYGSGKTNLAINHALRFRAEGKKVSVIDLDIVNPYFRTADSIKLFNEKDIGFVSTEFANTNLDIPVIPAKAYSAFEGGTGHYIVDLGGDDAGALALGRFADIIKPEDTEMLMVLNLFRPMTRTGAQALEMKIAIESAAGFRFTGIVNNSNLGPDTTAALVEDSMSFANEVSNITGLPIAYTAVESRFFAELEGRVQNLVPIEIFGGASKFNL